MYEASTESELDPNSQLYHPEISEEDTLAKLKVMLKHVSESSPFYQKKFKEANVDIEKIKSLEDLKLLPFTHKEELRDAYPLGLKAVSENEVIRIHS
jgi:phenylacetate-CoA ligase